MPDAIPLPTPLVSVDWLFQHLSHPQLVVIDCRFALRDPHQGRREYAQAHLPGAHYLDLNQDLSGPVQQSGGRHPLPHLATLVARLQALGISSTPPTAVVAYDASKGAFAARLWWLLRYLGHESVAVLQGGLPAWQAAGYPLTPNLPPIAVPGQLTPRVQTDWVVDRAAVQQRLQRPSTVLVDARSPERYRGEHEPIDPIPGAIPGAHNLFWQTNLDTAGQFKPIAALTQLWDALPPGDEMIVYCGSGVTACVNILALAHLNRPWPKLYVGGWSDWCTQLLADREEGGGGGEC